MAFTTISEFRVADFTVRFQTDAAKKTGMVLFPTAMASQLAVRRTGLKGLPEIDAMPDAGDPPAIVIDPLAHVKLVGDSYPGAFAQGRTMRGSPSNDRFAFQDQSVSDDGSRTTILTTLASADGHRIEHRLSWHGGDSAVEINTRFVNGAKGPVKLEMLTSFSLGGITPFDPADAPNKLRGHRFRSVWSAEGRLETQGIEELHLERSWSGAGMFTERFGQVGSMPVRGWFPFVAVEDTATGVVWGAQLAWAGSWQMEIFRQHDDVCISGGLADREFGQWMKTLEPGESLDAPPATISCVRGGLDDLCHRLTAVQNRAVNRQPTVEQDLPVIFNEWCTTWGDPSHAKVMAIADRLRGTDVRYLVIDAGWYKSEGSDWGNGHGDWVPSPKLFPDGLAATAKAIADRGLIPGLWFEMETVGDASTAFSLVDLFLHRDGIPMTVRSRRFWDLNNPAAVGYLSERVIGLLEKCGFGYLKVDYNETIGLGQDDPDGQGEGLRKQVLGVYRFFEKIRERLPNLVIENCSSGGHRLEPSMLARTAMSSFSDAHELVEIPIIAANLHRLILPRQNQIWAVLHGSDSDRRLVYSLAATFLGRMCLSGEIDRLTPAQESIVRRAISVYRSAVPIIRDGTSRRFGRTGSSWRHPTGWQATVRTAADGRTAMVVVHGFAGAPPEVAIPLPGSGWTITGGFGTSDQPSADVTAGGIRLGIEGDFSAIVLLLRRE